MGNGSNQLRKILRLHKALIVNTLFDNIKQNQLIWHTTKRCYLWSGLVEHPDFLTL
jgi:hypothetical protein